MNNASTYCDARSADGMKCLFPEGHFSVEHSFTNPKSGDEKPARRICRTFSADGERCEWTDGHFVSSHSFNRPDDSKAAPSLAAKIDKATSEAFQSGIYSHVGRMVCDNKDAIVASLRGVEPAHGSLGAKLMSDPRMMTANRCADWNSSHRALHAEIAECQYLGCERSATPIVVAGLAQSGKSDSKICGECAHVGPVGGHDRGCSKFREPNDSPSLPDVGRARVADYYCGLGKYRSAMNAGDEREAVPSLADVLEEKLTALGSASSERQRLGLALEIGLFVAGHEQRPRILRDLRAVEAVRALHRKEHEPQNVGVLEEVMVWPYEVDYCGSCHTSWPCKTINAIQNAETVKQ